MPITNEQKRMILDVLSRDNLTVEDFQALPAEIHEAMDDAWGDMMTKVKTLCEAVLVLAEDLQLAPPVVEMTGFFLASIAHEIGDEIAEKCLLGSHFGIARKAEAADRLRKMLFPRQAQDQETAH